MDEFSANAAGIGCQTAAHGGHGNTIAKLHGSNSAGIK
jgi:hypothetical protein